MKIKKIIKKTWEWFDKKKTIIGTVSLIIAKYLPEHTLAHQVLQIIGEVFGVIGVTHKLTKRDYGKTISKENIEKIRNIIKRP